MRETTLFEVMAEVGGHARSIDVERNDAADLMIELEYSVADAQANDGRARRDALKNAAALAILALHAHDAEAMKAHIYSPGPEGA